MATASMAEDNAPGPGARNAAALSGARARSRFVRRLRLALYTLMALIALNALIQIIVSDAGELADSPAAPDGEAERIINPRFTGRDQDGTPYIVTADAAIRRAGEAAVTDLERPRLDYALIAAAGPDASEVLAEAGAFDAERRVLSLQRDVSLRTRSGYAFATSAAELHLAEARVSGDQPVSGEAPWGRIRAGGFAIFDEGARVQFTNGVRTRIFVDAHDPDRTAGANAGAPEDAP